MPKFIKELPLLKTDVYKVGHMRLYPEGTTKIYSTLTPRRNEFYPWSNEMVAFGYQMFVERLKEDFDNHFFNQRKEDIVYTYKRVVGSVIGNADYDTSHIEALYDLGYLPIKIQALPEGTLVPMGVPVLTIQNTDKNFAWLSNYLETLILSETFVTSTVATTAHQFRKILTKYNKLSSDEPNIDYQIHDFSERGQHGNEASMLSGVAHLTSFKGSDTIQAPMMAELYYGADLSKIGQTSASVVATEHSVMEALSAKYDDGTDNKHQYEVYKDLLENNPTGILSVVSDTYDYWEVVDKVLPALKDDIMKRNGTLTIRPDDGDMKYNIEKTLNDLWKTFGGTINSKGYKVLDPHIRMIYGEGVTLDKVEEFYKLILKNGFSTDNIVFGVGAYVYSVLTTRDSFAQAIKAQVVIIDGKEKHVYKDPKNDPTKLKTSLKGAVVDYYGIDGKLHVADNLSLKRADNDRGQQLHTIFEDGKVKNKVTLDEIRTKLLEDIN